MGGRVFDDGDTTRTNLDCARMAVPVLATSGWTSSLLSRSSINGRTGIKIPNANQDFIMDVLLLDGSTITGLFLPATSCCRCTVK